MICREWFSFALLEILEWVSFALLAILVSAFIVGSVIEMNSAAQQSDRAAAYRCLEGGGFPVTNDIGVFRRCLMAEE